MDIPPEVYKAFREAHDDLNEEARKRAYAGHLTSMYNSDIIPPYMMGMTERFPDWLLLSQGFRARFYNMEREHTKNCMRSLATLLTEDTAEDADNTQTSLKKLRHKFKGRNEAFKESKTLMASLVARNRKARSKSLEEKEIKEHREQPSYESFAKEKLIKAPTKPKADAGRPLVFVPEPRKPLTEAEKDEIRKARNRRKNQKRHVKLRQLRSDHQGQDGTSGIKRRSTSNRNTRPQKKPRHQGDQPRKGEPPKRARRDDEKTKKTKKSDKKYPTVNGVVQDGEQPGTSGQNLMRPEKSSNAENVGFRKQDLTGITHTIQVVDPRNLSERKGKKL